MRLRTDHMQATAAAKAGLSVATARRIDGDPRPPSAKRQRRAYRTRPDPLADLWEEVAALLGAAPGLRPITLFDELVRRHPDRVGPSFRRTLERRVAEWKALHGPDQDVMFRQVQQPGRMGLSDFTDATDLGIVIGGEPLAHRLYHFALACSGFEHVEVVLGGESYPALANGLECALRQLGGVPREHRSDSLSAAFRNLSTPDASDLTRRFEALVVHFGMTPTRNNRGLAHENGAIESRHGHIKKRLAQALLLRGSASFDDLDAYRIFVADVAGQHNRRQAAMIEAERAVLRPLPPHPAMTWEEMTVRVTSASGFMCRHVFYTVPSRLVGHRLHLRIHDDRIEAYLGGSFLLALPRGRRAKGARPVHVVDYRHIIAALRAKPGALANLAYRDALWPRAAYRRAWEALASVGPVRDAARIMVGLLALAHDRCVEADLATALDATLEAGELPDLAIMLRRFTPAEAAAPAIRVILPSLAAYDRLITPARRRGRAMTASPADTAQLPAMLTQLRLPTVARLWQPLTETADRESWPAARTLAALLEHEIAERAQRRTARHLLEARLPVGKTIDRFDFAAVTSISKARVTALAEGDGWLAQGTNILLFGPPGVGKTHLAAALGHAMVDAGYRVLFTRTTDLVQHLQAARQDLKLATAIEKLDKYHLLVLDDLSYVQKSQAETSVIFELISARYERRSLLITANQPFGAWDAIFPDPAMTVAAIDRLVHHSIILEMNTDSYRRKSAQTRRAAQPAASSPAATTQTTAS